MTAMKDLMDEEDAKHDKWVRRIEEKDEAIQRAHQAYEQDCQLKSLSSFKALGLILILLLQGKLEYRWWQFKQWLKRVKEDIYVKRES